MRMFFRILALVLSFVPQNAWATPADTHAKAESLLKKALEARDHGDCESALRLFRESHELEPNRGKLLNIAACEDQVGQLMAALAHFQEVSSQFPPGDDRLTLALQHMRDLELRIPRLTVKTGPDSPQGTAVSIDDQMLPPGSIGREVMLDPGTHVVRAAGPGRKAWMREVELQQSQREVIVVDLEIEKIENPPPEVPKVEAAPEPTPVAPTAEAPVDPATPPPLVQAIPQGDRDVLARAKNRVSPWSKHKASLSLLGVGAGLLATGIGVGVSILPSHDALMDECRARRCTSEDAAPLERKELATNVLLGAAGVAGVAAGVVFLFERKTTTNATTVSVVPMGYGGALRVRY